jgi:alpha-L-rhamnosidase
VWDSGRVDRADPWVLYRGPRLADVTRYFWTVRVWDAGGSATPWAQPSWFETGLSGWQATWIAGPERTGNLTPAEGLADDAGIRAAGDFCRPPKGHVDAAATEADRNDLNQNPFVWLALEPITVPTNQGACREIRPAPMLRAAFQVTKRVARARVYATGLGYNALTVNGRPASRSVLDPGFTDYGKTVQYTTHDVTGLLRAGENVIASVLGSGQYDDAAASWDWGWEKAQWRATPRLRAQLEITYADGTTQTVASDGSWKVSVDGPERYDNFYLGETYDARREIPGWDRPGFDASSWRAARVVDPPAGVVRAEPQEPIAVVDERAPGTVTHPAPGISLVDVGQMLTGWAKVAVDAPEGTAIELYYGEKLAGGVAVSNTNGLVAGQLQTDYYVARGTGHEVWTPRFSNKGFQYLRISGPGGTPLPPGASVEVLRIEQVRTGLAATSRFASGDATVDRIHRNTAWAIQNNVQGIITDTPTLEKNGWTGDAQLSSGTASTLFDTERLYTKLFQDMVDEQTPQGEVTLLAPTNVNYGHAGQTFKSADNGGATPAWDAFWFVLPWEAYRRYGDVRALQKTFPAMRRYLDDWIPKWTDKDGDGHLYTLTSGLGDWDPPGGVETIISLASTAYYAHMTKIAADAARALGKDGDAARYDALFARIRDDFNARFLSADGIYRETADSPFTQSAQILPLAFDLAPERLRRPLAAKLVEDIVDRRGGNAYVGILGAKFVLPVLFEAGYPDVAYGVVTQTDEPSWGYWTDALHWTSLGEYWDSGSRSRDHHMFGAVVQSFYEDLAGIRPLEPGYAAIEFKPQIPAKLDHAEASYQSVRGRVASSWRRDGDGTISLRVTVPPNATGVVRFGGVVRRVGSGSYAFRASAPAGTRPG